MGDTHRQNSIFYDASADSKCTCKFYQPPILMQKKAEAVCCHVKLPIAKLFSFMSKIR